MKNNAFSAKKIQEQLNYIYGLERFGIKLGLKNMELLMGGLNHPERKFKSVHITGTNGKGSTTAFLAQILQEAGYQVGMYTSPHLVHFNERIQINGENISDQELTKWIKIIKRKSEKQHLPLTFFEFTTALAFAYFAEKKVDYAVIEVGMGGRLDATNVVLPEVAIITNVAHDHTLYLGKTLQKIAKEKAGIIKENSFVITSEKKRNILRILENTCKEKKAMLCILDKQMKYSISQEDLSGTTFHTAGKHTKNNYVSNPILLGYNDTFSLSLLGKHQVRNALLAVLTARKLGISSLCIKKGLKKTQWPGRLQILNKEPLLLIDGAHNVAGMKVLVNFIKKLPRRKILLLGIAQDKKIQEMIQMIAPLFTKVIICKGNFKPADPEIIAKEVKKFLTKVEIIPHPEEAVKRALTVTKKNDLILATGSLYFIGDVMKLWE